MEESVTLASDARAKKLKAEGKDVLFLTSSARFSYSWKYSGCCGCSHSNGRASFYTVASGLPGLKAAINTYFERYYGYSVAANNWLCDWCQFSFILSLWLWLIRWWVIIPTRTGSLWGIRLRWQKAFQCVKPKEDNHFKITVEQLEAARTDKTKVLVLNSPSNPTGMIYSREVLAVEIGAIEHDIPDSSRWFMDVWSITEVICPNLWSVEAIRKQTIIINGI